MVDMASQQLGVSTLESTLEYLSRRWEPSAVDKQAREAVIAQLHALLQETFKPPSNLVARPYGSFIVSGGLLCALRAKG